MSKDMKGQTNEAFSNEEESVLRDGNKSTGLNFENDEPDPSHNENSGIVAQITDWLNKNKILQKRILIVVSNLAIFIYFGFATYHHVDTKPKFMCWCNGYGMLVLLFSFVYIGLFYFYIFKPYFGIKFYDAHLEPQTKVIGGFVSKLYVKIILLVIVVAAFATFLVFDTEGTRFRLRSIGAIAILFVLGFIFSRHRSRINWRPVILGFIFQTVLGILCIRWEVGRNIFKCIGNRVEVFLSFAMDGAEFVYTKLLVRSEGGVFAFAVLTTIYFFSFCISILYYLGAMQWILIKLGWILQSIMGTTVCESVNGAANIFLGMSESPLLIRPYILKLTKSELHAIMTSGFATVSGTVLAAYISYGAEPAHLITACVMAAPASLCYSKLFYPEIEPSKTTSDNIEMEKSTDTSVLDAASNGASQAISLILNIIANLIAFVSFVSLVDAMLVWLGVLVGAKKFSLQEIFRIIFMPIAYMIGIPWDQAGYVSEIIARKVVVNEFVAFERLGELKEQNFIEARSSAIATFAICGFANPSSMGIMIGALSAMAPNRRNAVTETAFRAFISATFVNFITASIAGLLMTEDIFNDFSGNSSSTDSTDVCV